MHFQHLAFQERLVVLGGLVGVVLLLAVVGVDLSGYGQEADLAPSGPLRLPGITVPTLAPLPTIGPLPTIPPLPTGPGSDLPTDLPSVPSLPSFPGSAP